MKATTPKQVLIAAKWILQHYGWCQGHFYSSNMHKDAGKFNILNGRETLTCCCLDGALSMVEADTNTANQAFHLMNEETKDLIAWNDQKGRTKKQVIALINRVIKKA